MALLRFVFGFLITVVVATAAVLNRGDVTFTWNPAGDIITLPLYGVTLCAMAVGFILGGVLVWLNMSKLRREKRRQAKEIKLLEREVKKLQNDRFSATPPATDLFPALPTQ
ncbi:MAG: lipopolysaccharide assembly protein LapA domain-containing protein [Alphaproteobacteria bacterium]